MLTRMLLVTGILVTSQQVIANQFDPDMAWPLCGRIADNPPQNWTPEQGCPQQRFGSEAHTDAPLSSTYGPRQLVSGGYRYDFHRGLDMAAPIGTPVFAITNGTVKKAGVVSGYSDPMVQIRHYRPGHSSCNSGNGCYHSNYMHLSSWVVQNGQQVSKGQLLGYTGASDSGFEHLHFEIRNAPSTDKYSVWSRDAIHPLSALPYPDNGVNNYALSIESITQGDDNLIEVSVALSAPISIELDLNRVEVELYRREQDDSLTLIEQPGNTANGDSGVGDGYYHYPAFMDFEQFNRQFSHKDSSKQSWEDFAHNSEYACPFAHEHAEDYNANTHMDKAADDDYQTGHFNGIRTQIDHYNANSEQYRLQLTFEQLMADSPLDNLCVKAYAVDVSNNQSSVITHNCG